MMLAAGTGQDAGLDTPTASDATLVRLAGGGDQVALAELWLRHGGAALDAARRVGEGLDLDAVLREVFTRTEASLRRGAPAGVPFRLLVHETIRDVVAGRAEDRTGLAAPGRSPLAQAYRSLPELWRSALWYLDVEHLPARPVALWLGVPAADLATVARSARAALGRSWVHAQARAWGSDTACASAVVRVSRYLRGQLRVGPREALEAHLSGCTRCSIVLSEYHDVARRLELVLLPHVRGAGELPRDDVTPPASAEADPAPPATPAADPATVAAEVPAAGLVPADAPAGPAAATGRHPVVRRSRRLGAAWPTCTSPGRRRLWCRG
jgi:DNA-directed RNA polymerase specialized sigma24 family protein